MAVNFPPYYTSQILNADGKPVAGGTIRAYFTGTESPAPLFASDGTPLGSSVSIDAAGNAVFCLRVGTTYRLRCIDADGAVVWTRDGVRALGETAGMENPMTDYGDLIVGGVAGEPVRLSMGTAGQMLTPSTLGQPHLEWVDIPVQTGDHKVMADTMDQAPGALTQKLKAGSNVTLTLDTSGGTRKVEISAATQEGDHKASTDGTDTPGYLEDKVVAGTGVSVTKTSGQLVVSATGADTNEVKAGAADNAPGVLNDKIGSISSPNGYIRKQLHTNVDGSQTLLLGIDATSATDGQVLTAHEIDGVCDPQWQTIPTQPGDHHVLVTNADASAGTLADKLVAGSNVTLTTNTDGDGVQTLEISATGGGGGGGGGASFCEPFGSMCDGFISLNMGSTTAKIAWFGRTPLRNTKIKSVLVGTFGTDTNPYSELGIYAMRSNRALTLIDKVQTYTLTPDGSQFFEFSTPVTVGNEIIFIGSLCAPTLTWRNTYYTIMQTTTNASLISQMQKTSGVFLDANKNPVIAYPFATTPNEAQQNVCSRRGFYWPTFSLSTLPASTTSSDWHVTGSWLALPYVAIETIS